MKTCTVGPFTRLRLGADMRGRQYVGNFVEAEEHSSWCRVLKRINYLPR
ncbi:hypothetical protein O9993_14685 [Vibrio lentus]|nr:hypothetical protein [Vibrio lentus]